MAYRQDSIDTDSPSGSHTPLQSQSDVMTPISDAQTTDLEQIESLLQSASLPLDGVADHMEDFMVIRDGKKIIGAICMEDYNSDVLLRSVVVAETFRSKGVGSTMVNALLERARNRKKEHIYLLTDTAPVFFERFGFRYIEIDELPDLVRTSKEFSVCSARRASAMMLDLNKGIMDGEQLKSEVKRKYSKVARVVDNDSSGDSCNAMSHKTQVTRDLYSSEKSTCIPGSALQASRGCGDPTSGAGLKQGEVVLDLGCGAGADVFLSAREVGIEGKIYGLDMTDEMLDLARKQAVEYGFENVEFIKGEIEDIPLPDQSVDVVISNCVISLVPDKEKAFKEISRVLKPGGRISISDIVSTEPMSPALKKNLDVWLGCLGGALLLDDYNSMLGRTGFDSVNIEKTRVYDLRNMIDGKKAEANSDDDSHIKVLSDWRGELLAAAITAVRSG